MLFAKPRPSLQNIAALQRHAVGIWQQSCQQQANGRIALLRHAGQHERPYQAAPPTRGGRARFRGFLDVPFAVT